MVVARKGSIIENFHGTKVADPYRWLEDPASTETKEWAQAMGEKSNQYFSEGDVRAEDKGRLTELWDYEKYTVPKKVNNRLFFQRNSGLQNQAVLYMQDADKEPVVLIDPNTLSDDGTVALINYTVSNNGKYVAFSISTHGSDEQEIRVREIESQQDTKDVIEHVKFSGIAWMPNDSGFYYSRFPTPGTVEKEDENNYNKVYFHTLGSDQSEDEVIYEQPDEKELMFQALISDDEEYLCFHVNHGTAAENRFYVQKLGEESVVRLLDEQDAEYVYITNEGSTFYFKTNNQAPNGRIIAIDLKHPEKEHWEEIVPEQKDVIAAVVFLNDEWIVAFVQDAHHILSVYAKDGSFSHEIELNGIGSLTGMNRSKETNELFFGVESYLHPTITYVYDSKNQTTEEVDASVLPIDTEKFETTQIMYPSKDGTMIPMFLTHSKGLELNGQHPVILSGYGGFNISITPSFNPAIMRWVEKGGIYAEANLRGGDEYGEEWHRAGMLENKQNVFDDFIAAGEWLIENKYTNNKKLSTMGGSNGGLLVAACMVQRPDLFGAVLCRVPVIDMLRYHKFTIGRYWIPEFGNADKESDFPFLYAYSPLHNIKEGVTYPPVLIATAESDDRVVPAHAKKFAATLLDKAHSDSTVVLRLEAKAGHGLGKPIAKVIDEWVDFFAFLDKELQ